MWYSDGGDDNYKSINCGVIGNGSVNDDNGGVNSWSARDGVGNKVVMVVVMMETVVKILVMTTFKA